MAHKWFLLLSSSVFLAAIISWVRFVRIDPSYRPFLFCIWLGAFNELLSAVFTLGHINTAINNNIFVLLEAALLIWQFQQWNILGTHKRNVYWLLLTTLTVWLLEIGLLSHISTIASWFRLYYATVIVVLSIRVSTRLIVVGKGPLVNNSVFLISIGLMIFFTYKILVEIFWLQGFNSSHYFLNNIYAIMAWVNLVANIIYAIAVLWMPGKQPFTMPY